MLQVHCRTNNSVGKSVGTESRRSWVQVPLSPTSLTSKLSHEVLYICIIKIEDLVVYRQTMERSSSGAQDSCFDLIGSNIYTYIYNYVKMKKFN